MQMVYAALTRGDLEYVRAECARLLAARPAAAAPQHALGLSYCAEGRLQQAVPHLERAADTEPAVRWTRDVGIVCAALHRWQECLDRLTPIVSSLDVHAVTAYLLAGVETHRAAFVLEQLESRGDWSTPVEFDARCAYASALTSAGRHLEAEPLLLECLERSPGTPYVHDALSELFDNTDRSERALYHRTERVRLEPDNANARMRLAISLAQRGWASAAREQRQAAARLGLSRPQEHSSQMFMMLSDECESAATLLTAARQGFVDCCAPSGSRLTRRTRVRRRRRIGYVSAETRGTPSYYFFRPFLENHDRAAVEVTVLNCSPIRDRYTAEFERWSEHWREVSGMAPGQVATWLRSQEFDVLVDLSGHFPFNGLRILVDRAAPVQIAYPNYPGTTGNPCVDYLVTDWWTSPAGVEAEYTEQLYRIPSGYLGFDVSGIDLDVSALPWLTTRRPTFGVFQRLSKFSTLAWDALGRVMVAVPEAHLAMLCGDHELARADSETHRRALEELESRGVDRHRVSFPAPRGRRDQLLAMADIDVALDTFPYNGQTTTCESLWMGLPVVTLYGHSHVGRVTGGLLSRVGHSAWIAQSLDDYCEIAVRLVSSVSHLAGIRRQLRSDVIRSGLVDGPRLARELEAAYASLL